MTRTIYKNSLIVAGLFAILSGSPRSYAQTANAAPSSRPAPPSPSGPSKEGSIVAVWAIQMGAFADSANAARLCTRLRAKGLVPVTYPNLIDGKRLLHLVWVGTYGSPQDAIPEIARIEGLTGIRGVLREQMVWRKKQ